MGRRSLAIAFVLLLAFAPRGSAAESLSWRPLAFEGTRVTALAVAGQGQVLYLATEVGLHVSEDGGETWHYAGHGLDRTGAPHVVSLAVHPHDYRIAYAGTERGPGAGLYVTRDLGMHWERIYANRREDGIRALAVSSGDPDVIFVSILTHDGTDDELIISRDGGRTWQVRLVGGSWHAVKYYTIALGPYTRMPSAPAFEPSDSLRVYVASTQGVFVSPDGGRQLHSTSTPKLPTYGLALYEGRFGVLYASRQREMDLSRDWGETWQPIQGPELSMCQLHGRDGLVMGPAQAPVLFAATRSLCQDEPARVYAQMTATEGLRQWVEVGQGLPAAEELWLVVGGGDNPRLYALTPDGLWVAGLRSPVFLAAVQAENADDGTGRSARPPGVGLVDETPQRPPRVGIRDLRAAEVGQPGSVPAVDTAEDRRNGGLLWLAAPLAFIVGIATLAFARLVRRRGIWLA